MSVSNADRATLHAIQAHQPRDNAAVRRLLLHNPALAVMTREGLRLTLAGVAALDARPGRQPKPNAPTPTQRATASVQRRKAAGGRRLNVLLSAEGAEDLDRLKRAQALDTDKAALELALEMAARKGRAR